MFARRHEEASEQFHNALELDPNFFTARSSLGVTYFFRSRLEDSIREFQGAIDSSDRDQWPVAYLGAAYAASGDRNHAREIITELEERRQSEYVCAMRIAGWK
jgi:tetratricopeptide (TPR) repeat protein